MVAFTCYLTTWEAETGGSQVQDKRHETLAYKKKNLLSEDIIKIADTMDTSVLESWHILLSFFLKKIFA